MNWNQYYNENLKDLERDLKNAVNEKNEEKVSKLMKELDVHKKKYINLNA